MRARHVDIGSLRPEFRPMFTLAAPVVIAELGWITMGMVDTLMVGRLGAVAIGATGIGSSLSMGVSVFALGTLLGLDTYVSHAFGARRLDECHRWLIHGLTLAAIMTVPVTLLLWLLADGLGALGIQPEVTPLTQSYLRVVAWGTLPLLMYFALRRYLQGMGVVRPVMYALVAANLFNAAANWTLIFGRFGLPALGVAGAAWATLLSRVLMTLWLVVVIVLRERGQKPGLFSTALRLELDRMRQLLRLGVSAATQLTLEVGVFAAATALAGRLPAAELAAHQIAMHLAGFTFMVPLGLASAGAVRVGHAMGRRDPAGAARAGWTALLFGTVFMSTAALVFLTLGGTLFRGFTTDPVVIATGVSLLAVAAVFQLFDGLQGVATGVLRGLGDTRTPMLWNLVGHWFLGLPAAYTLAFGAGYGAVGLWWGLSTGLIICGVALLVVWTRRVRAVLRLLPVKGGGVMAEEKRPPEQEEPPRPHGDPLQTEIVAHRERPADRPREPLGEGFEETEPDTTGVGVSEEGAADRRSRRGGNTGPVGAID